MVAEADESDRSFLKLTPTVAIVTNIDREHLDTYKDLADVQEAFLGFVNKVPFYGAAVLCLDDAPVQDILPRVERRVVTYGVSPPGPGARPATCVLAPLGSTYTALRGRRRPGHDRAGRARRTTTSLNSLAAVAVGLDLACPSPPSRPALAVLHRRRPAVPAPRRSGRRHRGRRLRPPPDGDPRHPRDPARPRGHAGAPWCSSSPTATRARSTSGTSSAAPSTWPTSLAPGRHLSRGRGADRRAITSEALAEAIGQQGHRQVVYARRPASGRRAAGGRGARGGRRPDPGRGQRVDGGRGAAPPQRSRPGGGA